MTLYVQLDAEKIAWIRVVHELDTRIDVLSSPYMSRRMHLKVMIKIVAKIDTHPAEKNAGL